MRGGGCVAGPLRLRAAGRLEGLHFHTLVCILYALAEAAKAVPDRAPSGQRNPAHQRPPPTHGQTGQPSRRSALQEVPSLPRMQDADEIFARIKRSSAESPVQTPTRASRQPEGRRTAMCIVGLERTFSMPLVHTNLKTIADQWSADVYIYTRSVEAPMPSTHRMGGRHVAVDCARNMSVHALLQPVIEERVHDPSSACKTSGAVQFHQIGQCFLRGIAYAQAWALPAYDVFVRVRPDSIIELPVRPPWDYFSNPSDERPLVPNRHRDGLFALTAQGLRMFLREGNAKYRRCHRDFLEYLPYLSRGNRNRGVLHWDICYLMVRDGHVYSSDSCVDRKKGFAFANATRARVNADPSLAHCSPLRLPSGSFVG